MRRHQETIERYLADIADMDPDIGDEVKGGLEALARSEAVPRREGDGEEFALETIVLRVGRPVLDVRNDEAVLEIEEVESQVWKKRLSEAKHQLALNISAVGRIEVDNHPRVDWLGTGWLLRDNVVVTNRHVAEIFAQADGAEFRFRPGLDGSPMSANIDFVEEFDNQQALEYPLFRVLHIEEDGGPDLAFLRIESIGEVDLPDPIVLSSAGAQSGDLVAAIGYPARDPFFPDQDLMNQIFKGRYDKKRLAPGLITNVRSTRIHHDCSTLGGNSGAEVVSLATGEAVALHFAGTLFEMNHAVPAEVVGNRLDDVLAKRTRRSKPSSGKEQVVTGIGTTSGLIGNVINATIPIRVRIEVGDTTTDVPGGGAVHAGRLTVPVPNVGLGDEDDDLLDLLEARPEDYVNRQGYLPDFLGAGFEVPRPVLTRNEDDTLTFDFNGETRDVLDYEHFSVLMSERRRLCRWSACCINGAESRKRKRKGWRFDSRISTAAQVMKECYGNLPKFSRGHMTRREDPVWGSDDEASTGNVDSMHVTNAVPQIQPFNAGIWLKLEDYALDHTREDDMKICVFTGPFLEDDDPIRFGVQIPVSFWKIIAFVHDETGELSATGYVMSQESFIGEEEFVFGQHDNRQRPVSEIEQRAGISFGRLADVDPFRDAPEAAATALLSLSQIRFVN